MNQLFLPPFLGLYSIIKTNKKARLTVYKIYIYVSKRENLELLFLSRCHETKRDNNKINKIIRLWSTTNAKMKKCKNGKMKKPGK